MSPHAQFQAQFKPTHSLFSELKGEESTSLWAKSPPSLWQCLWLPPPGSGSAGDFPAVASHPVWGSPAPVCPMADGNSLPGACVGASQQASAPQLEEPLLCRPHCRPEVPLLPTTLARPRTAHDSVLLLLPYLLARTPD